jgi:hypothetical protein
MVMIAPILSDLAAEAPHIREAMTQNRYQENIS